MKNYLVFIVTAALLCTLPEASHADSIKGRLGVTGRLGLMVSSDIDYTGITPYTIIPSITVVELQKNNAKAETAFVGGGGFIYGVTDHFAVEVDVTHTPEIDYDIYSGLKALEITTTNVSLGLQYRFLPENRLVPYLGGGVDFILSDGKYLTGDQLNIDTVMGGHVNIGADFFVTKRIALNADFRGVLGPKANIYIQNSSLSEAFNAEYDPNSFVALFGVRFFLN
jgi:outer membrane protein